MWKNSDLKDVLYVLSFCVCGFFGLFVSVFVVAVVWVGLVFFLVLLFGFFSWFCFVLFLLVWFLWGFLPVWVFFVNMPKQGKNFVKTCLDLWGFGSPWQHVQCTTVLQDRDFSPALKKHIVSVLNVQSKSMMKWWVLLG